MSARWFHLAQLAEQLAHLSSKLKKRAAIAQAVAATYAAYSGGDAGLFAMYLAGTPFAEADPRKLNAGGALLTRAVLTVSGATDTELTEAYRRHGDLGAAAFDLLAAHPSHRDEAAMNGAQEPLTLAEVAEAFAAMAVARTTAVRAALVDALLRRATPIEAKYLLKLMLGDMRIGVKQSLVEEAIADAASADVAEVRHAVMLEADLAHATARAFAGTLAEARMTLFHPLGFMLASPVETPEEAVERFTAKPPKTVPEKKSAKAKRRKKGEAAESELDETSETDAMAEIIAQDVEATEAIPAGQLTPAPSVAAFLEDKYDGMRAQVHCADPQQPGRVAIYSRNREDITESFPEIAEAFAKVPADLGAFIFDGEILGWDFDASAEKGDLTGGRALPFAVLGQRIGRKRVSNEWRVRVPVIFMAFDLMYAGDALTLELPLRERRNRLEAAGERLVELVVSPLEEDERRGLPQSDLFTGDAAAKASLPRLILSPSRLVESAEDIDRAYAAARARANEGVMIKSADSVYQPGRRGLAWVKLKRELATLDVVITGAEYGSGRRAGSLSDYTFAVRGPSFAATGELLNVGKAYSGVTDIEIAELTEFLKAHTLEDHGHFRTVEPLVILEVAFNNIMRSTRHASGFALRFPRILRLRPDKPLAEIDTVERVEEVYQSQVDKPVEA